MTAAQVLSGERRWSVEQGDCLELLRTLPDARVDAMVCDPPAGIAFMGKGWDGDKGGRDQWIAWLAERMREAFRALKPGGHALVWALPRTSHWTATALDDAGFEVRDRIAHFFGSGFPKSVNVGKSDPTRKGWGSALKPACEDWWLVRKPMRTSIAKNIAAHGTGAINIDGCRVPHASAADLAQHTAGVEAIKARGGVMGSTAPVQFMASDIAGASDVSPAGRWPAHVVLSHGPDCERIGVRRVKAAPPWGDERQPSLFTGEETSQVQHADGDGFETVEHWRCAQGCPVALLDEQSGVSVSSSEPAQRWGRSAPDGWGMADGGTVQAYGDEGGASRYFSTFAPFFYTPKCDRTDREKGCEYLPAVRSNPHADGSRGAASPHAGTGRLVARRNHHPTVKSTDLMRWLVRLITPPGGLVLDPFTGSGSTGVACSAEGMRFIGFELDAAYVEISRARIMGDAPLLNAGGL